MQKLLVSIALVVCSLSLGAQSYWTSPTGFASLSGGHYGYFFGYFANGRVQFVEGELPRQSATLTAVSYRTQSINEYFTYNGMGRQWNKVTLVVGEGNINKLTSSFNTNYSTKSTLVFSASLKFPTQSGRPKQAWGNVVRIPFGSNYAYSGKNDLILDYTFAGGSLANRGDWTYGRSYQTDNVLSSKGFVTLFPRYYPSSPFTTQRCNDSAVTHGFGAYVYARAELYSDAYAVTSRRGKVALTHSYAQHTAPDSPLLMAMSVGGFENGVAAGAQCNKLYVDFGWLFALQAAKTGSLSRAPSDTRTHLLPTLHRFFDDRWAGATSFMQAAWVDSKTNRFSLSVASRLQMPRKPRLYKKKLVYEYIESRTKQGPVVSSSTHQQTLPRLARK